MKKNIFLLFFLLPFSLLADTLPASVIEDLRNEYQDLSNPKTSKIYVSPKTEIPTKPTKEQFVDLDDLFEDDGVPSPKRKR